MKEELPSLEELEAKRLAGIENALSDGSIRAACRVAEAQGERLSIRRWTGTFREWEEDGVRIKYYKTTKSFSPLFKKYLVREVIKVEYQDRGYVYLVLDESETKVGEHEFVVPGEWQKIVWEAYEQLGEQESDLKEEQELERRQELARLLHIAYEK